MLSSPQKATLTLGAWLEARRGCETLWDLEVENSKVAIVNALSAAIVKQLSHTLHEAVTSPKYTLPTKEKPLKLSYPMCSSNCTRLLILALPEKSCVREWLRAHSAQALVQPDLDVGVDAQPETVVRTALCVDRSGLNARIAQLGELCASRLWNRLDVLRRENDNQLCFEVLWQPGSETPSAKLSSVKHSRSQQIMLKVWIEANTSLPDSQQKLAPSGVIVVGDSKLSEGKSQSSLLSKRK